MLPAESPWLTITAPPRIDVLLDFVKELVDTEGLVEHRFQPLLAGLDDRMRRIVAEARHEDHRQVLVGLREPGRNNRSPSYREGGCRPAPRRTGRLRTITNASSPLWAVSTSQP